MINDSEVHQEVINDGDISPDEFRIMFGEISSSRAMRISSELGKEIFEAAGWNWTPDMDAIIKIMFAVAYNPQLAEDILAKSSGYAQYVMTLYLKADAEYRQDYDSVYPSVIQRGDKDKAVAQVEHQTSGSRNLKNYLRNTYYNLTRTANAAQSILKMHVTDSKLPA